MTSPPASTSSREYALPAGSNRLKLGSGRGATGVRCCDDPHALDSTATIRTNTIRTLLRVNMSTLARRPNGVATKAQRAAKSSSLRGAPLARTGNPASKQPLTTVNFAAQSRATQPGAERRSESAHARPLNGAKSGASPQIAWFCYGAFENRSAVFRRDGLELQSSRGRSELGEFVASRAPAPRCSRARGANE